MGPLLSNKVISQACLSSAREAASSETVGQSRPELPDIGVQHIGADREKRGAFLGHAQSPSITRLCIMSSKRVWTKLCVVQLVLLRLRGKNDLRGLLPTVSSLPTKLQTNWLKFVLLRCLTTGVVFVFKPFCASAVQVEEQSCWTVLTRRLSQKSSLCRIALYFHSFRNFIVFLICLRLSLLGTSSLFIRLALTDSDDTGLPGLPMCRSGGRRAQRWRSTASSGVW